MWRPIHDSDEKRHIDACWHVQIRAVEDSPNNLDAGVEQYGPPKEQGDFPIYIMIFDHEILQNDN